MKSFGNIEIYVPSCPLECHQIIDYAIEHVGLVYIRLDGKDLPQPHDENYRFEPGKIDQLREGKNIALVAMGSTVYEIVHAAEQLAEKGISAGVISVPSIRPCDTQQLRNLLNQLSSRDQRGRAQRQRWRVAASRCGTRRRAAPRAGVGDAGELLGLAGGGGVLSFSASVNADTGLNEAECRRV